MTAYYAKLTPFGETTPWNFNPPYPKLSDPRPAPATYAGYYVKVATAAGEGVLTAISKDNKYLLSLYRHAESEHDLVLAVTYLYPDSGYTDKGRVLSWLLN